MNIFFGKISQKIDTAQLTGGYYTAPKGSSWYGDLEPGDYVYLIGGNKIQFWKARDWGIQDGKDCMHFDILNDDLGITVSQLITLRYFKITKTLAVLTSRSARNKAFFKIDCLHQIPETDIYKSEFYKNDTLYRSIKIVSSENTVTNSEDIQILYKDHKLSLVDNDFMDNGIKKHFIDNLDKIGKGSKRKDTVLQFFSNALSNLPVAITHKQVGFRSFYDAFFCEYKENAKYYLVGAFWDTASPQDQTDRFVKEGVWINGYDDKFNQEVNAVPIGSNIAIKAAFVREKSKSVMAIKARGIVVDNKQDGQTLLVEWEEDFTSFEVNFGGYMNTIKEVNKQEHIQSIWFPENISTVTTNSNEESDMKNKPLNQILYGPPGTGKTYNTINKALSILEPKTQEQINEEERDVLKARFDDYVKKGQIVFTTFHQSMSYEDFIEGIKPLKPEDEDEFVKYDVEEGIFKGLCRQAIKEFYQKGRNDETFERLNSFENAWNDLLENVQFSIDNNVVFPLDTKSGQAMDAFEISNRGNLYLRPQYEGAKDYTVSHDRAQKLFEAFPNLEVVSNIDKEFRSVIGGANSTAYWSVLNYIIKWLNENPTAPSIKQTTEISDTLVKFDNKIVKDNITSSVLNYVIIIDEINRGNVSQIFGELITLIEEDKRLGKDEALEVLLPYSKEKFGVPPNLYIIGTMNTADRSVEALDTALRRRFCFEEIQSNPQLIATKGKLKESIGEVEGISLPRVLETINNRIEILSNRDHKIGHSYFMKVASLEDLKATFKKNIIPLLQEYFYNDYEKIGWVVGEGFFVQQKIDKKAIFTKFFKEPKPEFEVAYQLADIDTIDIKKAMLQLLGDFKEEPQTENIEN